MKAVVIGARILLGLIFLIFGLNGFLHFIPAPPLTGLVAEFMDVFAKSHWLLFVAAIQVIAGALLLIDRYVPLAIALLAPVLANILVFHITMQPQGLPPGVLATVLWVIVAWPMRTRFAPIFAEKA